MHHCSYTRSSGLRMKKESGSRLPMRKSLQQTGERIWCPALNGLTLKSSGSTPGLWTQPSLRTTARPKEQFHSPSDMSPYSRFYKQTKCVHVLFGRWKTAQQDQVGRDSTKQGREKSLIIIQYSRTLEKSLSHLPNKSNPIIKQKKGWWWERDGRFTAGLWRARS